ncbi:LysR substrate-binding domain-containing protein [Sorangium sp. So ce861]|uniref:LysR substrate-binding domain-containing protein n=1 Tax=Sorangium sp. So ce861 TaxID=3133323 RepID=UPI003F6140CB
MSRLNGPGERDHVRRPHADQPERPGRAHPTDMGYQQIRPELAKTFALQGRGIALLPESLCAEEVRSGALARLSSIHRVPALPLYLVMPSRAHVPARLRALVDFIADPENVSSLL